jgi:nucleoside-diphosphate-sugar epimerase
VIRPQYLTLQVAGNRMGRKMRVLVVGATGATGRLVTEQLLARGCKVQIVVRAVADLPDPVANHDQLSVVHASILDLGSTELADLVQGCQAVVSCLGHNLSFEGMFGQPRRLVTDATRRLCTAVDADKDAQPVKFVLMNTTGNSNRDLDEQISFSQKVVIWILRHLLPPHADNEEAADYLRTEIGQNNPRVEWVAVRPDGLIDDKEISKYKTHPSPTRSAIFDAGSVSRVNVAHFMAELITNDDTWKTWKGRMPVIYGVQPETVSPDNT